MKIYNLSLSLNNLSFITKSAFHRSFYQLTENRHPTSLPYLSGDAFRSISQYIFDEHTSFRSESVTKNAVVFVKGNGLHYFFKCVHPHIRFPYVLISHNSDTQIDVPYTSYIDNKILHWFAQNVLTVHKSITPIPIGLENLSYYNHGIPEILRKLQTSTRKKQSEILIDFTVHTNSVIRKPIFEQFRKAPTAHYLDRRLVSPEYLRELAKYEFVLSPPGNGLDCHRTWEAMYVGTIPIVQRSPATEYFSSIGLPLLLVSDWKELLKFSTSQLSRKFHEIRKKSDISPLTFDFWKDLIYRQRE